MSAAVKSAVPKSRMWAVLATAFGFLSAIGTAAEAASEAPRAHPSSRASFVNELAKEARSAELCEQRSDRMFVRHMLGSACIAYFVTSGREAQRRAVVFLDGDVPIERYADTAMQASELAQRRRWQQSIADRFGVRIVQISRLGVEGSSGNHGDRRKPEELVAMNAALDVLKQRLGLDDLVLAGQSGGSTLIASMLTRGRGDVACAVLGSGAYELVDLVHASIRRSGGATSERTLARVVYDPSTQIEGVRRAPDRRIFVLADRGDVRTPFDQQQRFAVALAAAGHHARLIAIQATGELRHGATAYAVPLAALCARDASEQRIVKAAADMRSSFERRAQAVDARGGGLGRTDAQAEKLEAVRARNLAKRSTSGLSRLNRCAGRNC